MTIPPHIFCNVFVFKKIINLGCNSWGVNENFGYPDCYSGWYTAIDNCEAAGVVTVWATGNEGPSSMENFLAHAGIDRRSLSHHGCGRYRHEGTLEGQHSRGNDTCRRSGPWFYCIYGIAVDVQGIQGVRDRLDRAPTLTNFKPDPNTGAETLSSAQVETRLIAVMLLI